MNGDEFDPDCNCPECSFFEEGDIVQLRTRHDITGMVVGEHEWGRKYDVRLATSMTIMTFFAVELRLLDLPDADGGEEVESEEAGENFTDSNVIPFINRKVAGSA